MQSVWRVHLGLAVVCAGAMVAPLDTMVNTAFPVITQAFDLPLRDIQWVVIAFVLAQSSLALVFGHLGDRFGHRRIFAIGLAASVLAHAAVAMAPSFAGLVATRVLQGVAVGITISCAPALATLMFAPHEKPRVLARYMAANSAAMALGPWVGGLLIQAFGWPGVFGSRVPLALAALLLLPLLPALPAQAQGSVRAPTGRQAFDWLGAIGLASVLVCLAMAMTELTRPEASAWTGGGLLAAGLMLGLAFVRHENRVAHPVLRMAPFGRRDFRAIQMASVMVNFACFANLLLVPYVLTRDAGLAIATAGLVLSAYPGGSVLGSLLAGRLSQRFGASALMRAGLAGASLGLLLSAALLWLISPSPWLALGLLASGLGQGLFQVGNMDATTSMLPVHERGVAGSLVSVTRLLGILLGASGISWLQSLSGKAALSFVLVGGALALFSLWFAVRGESR